MNLKMLASLAGVSVSTVSKAFSHSDEISSVTKEKIFKIAKENGCFDRYNKDKFDKKVIAVICHEVCSDYYSDYVTRINQYLQQHNCIMTVGVDGFSESKKAELFSYYSSYCNVDGIIVIGTPNFIDNHYNIPAVCIGNSADSENIDCICIDFYYGIKKMISHLKSLGHTKIGFVGESLTYASEKHYIKAMEEENLEIDPDFVFRSNKRFEEAGRDAVLHYKTLGKFPSAVFAAYDNIAIGFMKAAKKEGIKIPEELSIVGTDDININDHLDVSLSSISTKTDFTCKLAVETIINKIKSPYYHLEDFIVRCDYIIRDSVMRKI